ncbi:hypothetical protein DUT91_24015 [Phyllobacterium salinisoli]|uniref:Uncharacterized protein n=1 Tax=Phyllobacterium salinisoli TaxID=1899321 RepID=A0A368JZ60_9HYPH|nr:DUF6622 family protein [Phyllobacterium salinisoli]RCS21452.1 hypothetical protein DUT91_24015 [Phyllobacterium salinisoli]
MSQAPARLDPLSGLIHRPGTPVTLILVSIGFLAKYALSVALAHQPDLAANTSYNVFYGAVAGAVDGVFWGGGTILQLYRAFGRNGNKAARSG